MTDDPTGVPLRRRLVTTALTVAFAAAVLAHLWGLYWPRVDLPSDAPLTDKWAHLAGFGVPVALAWLRFPRHRTPLVAAFAAHAVISEVLQGLVLPNRVGDSLDALADLIGVALGVAVGWGTRALVRTITRPS